MLIYEISNPHFHHCPRHQQQLGTVQPTA
ncbi:hypothetical protein FRY97_07725 [Phaeodactylibacter luteus]|uniref:Uncharacterized protein n=1 Tax=Phaeodactylibacter luteus TaxID=1564516 RepID=A0A5C6RPD9_9BACT|nr:hypothetical protein FRY97_07725 [Phaeodactylibacter luteus]